MALRVLHRVMRDMGELRYEPTAKRVRASLGGRTVVDSRRAVLVWEPRRIVPTYAVPVDDVDAELVPAAGGEPVPVNPVALGDAGRSLLSPSTGFGHHTADGEPLTIRSGATEREAAAFRLRDPDLTGYVVLDFGAFDEWLEEDERIVSHPRDPFKRIDVLDSTRRVRIEHDGQVLADTTRARWLFETALPVRYYIPRDDVRMRLLRPTDRITFCAYKGQASYWSAELPGGVLKNVAWTYENPLFDAQRVRGLVAFFNERVDIHVDGERQTRPRTPWS